MVTSQRPFFPLFILSLSLFLSLFYSIKVQPSSLFPKFWKNPYINQCQDEDLDSPSAKTIQALKDISGEKDCQKSFEKLSRATAFVLIGKKISVLSSLRTFQNLRQLYLTQNEISDHELEYLSELTHLEVLFLNGNRIKDISPLKYLKNLRQLSIADNQVENVAALGFLLKLETLFLSPHPLFSDDKHCPTNSLSVGLNQACSKIRK